jgi:hypothetical protein
MRETDRPPKVRVDVLSGIPVSFVVLYKYLALPGTLKQHGSIMQEQRRPDNSGRSSARLRSFPILLDACDV